MGNFHFLLQVKISHCLLNRYHIYNIFLTSLSVLYEQLCKNLTHTWWKWIVSIKCQKYCDSNFIICYSIVCQSLLFCSRQYQRVKKTCKTTWSKYHYERNGFLLKFHLKISLAFWKIKLISNSRNLKSFKWIVKWKILNF